MARKNRNSDPLEINSKDQETTLFDSKNYGGMFGGGGESGSEDVMGLGKESLGGESSGVVSEVGAGGQEKQGIDMAQVGQTAQDYGSAIGMDAPLGSLFLGSAQEERDIRNQRMADVAISSEKQSGDPNKQVGKYSFLTEDLYIAPNKKDYTGDFSPNAKGEGWDKEQSHTFLGEWGANTERGATSGAQSGGWVGAIIGAVIGTGVGIGKGASRIKSERKEAKEFERRMTEKWLRKLEEHRLKRTQAEEQLKDVNREEEIARYKAGKQKKTDVKFQKSLSKRGQNLLAFEGAVNRHKNKRQNEKTRYGAVQGDAGNTLMFGAA